MSKNALLLMIAAMLCPALAGISGMATLDAASAEFMANMGEALAGSADNISSLQFNFIAGSGESGQRSPEPIPGRGLLFHPSHFYRPGLRQPD